MKQRIVVGFDFSERDQRVLETALREATMTPTELHALYVLEHVSERLLTTDVGPTALPTFAKRLMDWLRQSIDTMLDGCDAPAGLTIVVHTVFGSPAREIAHLASHLDAELIIVGTHGRRGVKRFVLGSVAEHVVRWAGCPVLTVRPVEHATDEAMPEIEPACPDCVARRTATNGEELWCARHSEHHPRANTYHYEQMSNRPARPWGFGRPRVAR